MGHFSEAPPEVVDLVTELIMLYHEPLDSARIGLLMCDKAPRSNGKSTWGKAKKISPQDKVLMPYDFVIWFAQDIWEELEPIQRRALADHELCHCGFMAGRWAVRSHDVEEFTCIISRYGFWRPALKGMEMAVQARLVAVPGKVEAVNLAKRGMDILDQIGDLFASKDGDEDDDDGQEKQTVPE